MPIGITKKKEASRESTRSVVLEIKAAEQRFVYYMGTNISVHGRQKCKVRHFCVASNTNNGLFNMLKKDTELSF